MVWIKNGLQKLQFGLQPRHRHLPCISGWAAGEGEKSGLSLVSQLKPKFPGHDLVINVARGWRDVPVDVTGYPAEKHSPVRFQRDRTDLLMKRANVSCSSRLAWGNSAVLGGMLASELASLSVVVVFPSIVVGCLSQQHLGAVAVSRGRLLTHPSDGSLLFTSPGDDRTVPAIGTYIPQQAQCFSSRCTTVAAGLWWGLKMAFCDLPAPAESQHSARPPGLSQGGKIKRSLLHWSNIHARQWV